MIALEQTELIIASITIVISITAILLPFMLKNQRARKIDFKKAMDTKADRELFLEKLKNQNLKILMEETRLNDHEEKNDTQFKMHTIGMEDVKTDVKHLVGRVDQILLILTKK